MVEPGSGATSWAELRDSISASGGTRERLTYIPGNRFLLLVSTCESPLGYRTKNPSRCSVVLGSTRLLLEKKRKDGKDGVGGGRKFSRR